MTGIRFLLLFVAACAVLLTSPPHASVLAAPSATFTVNSDLDVPDKKPGNGKCETQKNNGVCTLRAAIMETNRLGGTNTINLPADTYYLSLGGANEDNARTGDLDIESNLTIKGAGAATTVIDGSRGITGDRVFHILSGIVKFQDVTVYNGGDNTANTEHKGGGIFVNAGAKLTLLKTTVDSNLAAAGGGIYSLGTLVVKKSTISNNTASSTKLQEIYGGGIFNGYGGTATIKRSLVLYNFAALRGGGIHNSNKLTIKKSTIQYNTSDNSLGYYSYGGGIHNYNGNATIKDSTIEYNYATSFGGGITNFAPLLLQSSTVHWNSAHNGGGLYNGQETANIVNSTFVYNVGYGDGGGIMNLEEGTVQLLNATIVLNNNNGNIGYSGGLFNSDGTTHLRNSIISANSPHDCYGTFNSQDYNIIQDAPACTFTGATGHNILGQSAILGGFSNWGGPTWTVKLESISPAIDKGKPSGCTDHNGALLTTDQRGSPRPVNGDSVPGARCDMGAFEYP